MSAQLSNLPDLAARIRAEHAGVVATLQSSFVHAQTAGELLIAAKSQLKHGQWLPWLAEHCGIKKRTAQTYMKLAENREVLESKCADSALLTIDGAVKMLSAPRDTLTATAPIFKIPSTKDGSDGVLLPFRVALQNHPYADCIPEFNGFGFDLLVKSIREEGLSHPITLFEGKILDGRARYKACGLAGIEPRFVELQEDDNPLDYLYRKNVLRTHLTEDQQACLIMECRRIETQVGRRRVKAPLRRQDTYRSRKS
jgi:hypothetical protein